MKFIFRYPDANGTQRDMLDVGAVDEVARSLEQAGFDGIAFTEHPAPSLRWLESGGHQTLDPFVALSFAAAATERLMLLTYLCVLPYRNPLLVAKAAASVDRLSNGRMILGVGTGYLQDEFDNLGVDMDERNDIFDEALDMLPLHWSGEPFDYSGRHFKATKAIALPRPAQQPIPIWIGGNARLTRRRVAERAQGWMPLALPKARMAAVRTAAMPGVTELGKQIADIRDTARNRAAEIDVAYRYFDPSFQLELSTSSARHADAIAELAEVGVNWIVVPGMTSTRDETFGFIEAFAEFRQTIP